MSKLKQKRRKAAESGWLWYDYDGVWWAFHDSWHPLADHEKFITKREMYNTLAHWSLPKKTHELTISFS